MIGRRAMERSYKWREKLLTAACCCIWKGTPLMLDVLAALLLELQYDTLWRFSSQVIIKSRMAPELQKVA